MSHITRGRDPDAIGVRERIRRRVSARVVYPVLAVVTAVVALVPVLKLWHITWSIPITGYNGDANFDNIIVKSILDNGWFESNPDLGAPFGSKLYDFSVFDGDTGQLFAMKLIGLLAPHVGTVQNVYFLLTFPLTALTAYAALRYARLSRPTAFVIGELFAFIPYHFIRGINGHLFLSGYYSVPLSFLVLFWLTTNGGDRLLKRTGSGSLRPTRAFLYVFLAVAVIGCTGLYYSFFTLVLLVLSGVITLIKRDRGGALRTLAVTCMLAAVMGACFSPTLIYQHEHGTNALVGHRLPQESELYATKIAEMVLPNTNDRIGFLASLKTTYNVSAPAPPDYGVSLGLAGSIGFVLLLGVTFTTIVGARRFAPAVAQAAMLSTFTTLVITVGGLSSLFAYLVVPDIRAWYRLMVFVAFPSLLATGVVLDRLVRRIAAFPRGNLAAGVVLALVLVFGIYEQTTKDFVPPYAATAAAWKSDTKLGTQIEHLLPAGSEILELPYIGFPEAVLGTATAYDEARLYFHTENLKWSCCAMTGRPGNWLAAFATAPVRDVVRRAAASGFAGVYIYRPAYVDAWPAVESAIQAETGAAPIVSDDAESSFFDLRAYRARLVRTLGRAKLARIATSTLDA